MTIPPYVDQHGVNHTTTFAKNSRSPHGASADSDFQLAANRLVRAAERIRRAQYLMHFQEIALTADGFCPHRHNFGGREGVIHARRGVEIACYDVARCFTLRQWATAAAH